MAATPFEGFMALGTISGTTFTEENVVDYHRQSAEFAGGNTGGALFNNRNTAWGVTNAVAMYAAATGSDLICYWRLPKALNIQQGQVYVNTDAFTLDFTETTASAGAPVGTMTPTNGQEVMVVYAGSAFTATFGG